MTFRERFMNGEIPFEEIFTYTDQWNFSDDPITLREYLGLNITEEDIWISDSDEALEKLMEKERRTKILFTDLDGTLLSNDKQLTAGNREAIQQAVKAGHKIVINTGRPLSSAKVFAASLSLDQEGCYIIASNGGEIYDCKAAKSIYKKTIPLGFVRYIFDAAKQSGLHCQTYDDKDIIAEKDSDTLKRYQQITKITCRTVEDITSYLSEDPVKLVVINYESRKKLEEFRDSVTEWSQGKMDHVFSCDSILEFVAPGVSKGSAVSILCEELGIPICNTIAVGDAENDVSMIEAAAVGAVMANANADIKTHGNYITNYDNNHDAIAEVIKAFILNH